MCKILEIAETEYKLGITKIFLKDKVFHKLEGRRNKLFAKATTEVQKYYRGYLDRMDFWIIKGSAELLQYWFRSYLKAADPTDKVREIIAKLKSEEDAQVIVQDIMELEKLGIRDKNVEIISDLGGVTAIIDVSNKYKDNKNIRIACTRALSRFSNSDENATKVARSGGIKQMVSHVHGSNDDDSKEEDDSKESMELINKLSAVKTNVNIVIKEGTVNALKKTLNSNSENAFVAAKALGTITKHRKAAARIGRDEQAIETVLNSIRKKPKFGRMVTYSVNCVANLASNKHNWESIVELGGIEVAMLALKNHVGNASVLKEVGRLFSQLCKNADYAKTLCECGALDLCLKYMETNADGCGVAASKLINDLTIACPKAAAKVLLSDECKGQSVIANALHSTYKRPDLASALCRTVNVLCSVDDTFVESLAHCSAPRYVLTALQTHPGLSVVKFGDFDVSYSFPIDCIESLLRFAKFDGAFMDAIKQDGAVAAIAMSMDRNPEMASLMSLGADALGLFAEQDDLRHAMDIIARSRMEADSFSPKIVAEAIGIVANLALIPVNAQYIVSEGGIAILLSIISGQIKLASGSSAEAQILASAVRGIGRLLGTSDNAVAFQDEGGLAILTDIVKSVPHSEVVMNAVCDALNTLFLSKEGLKFVHLNMEIVELLTSRVFCAHPEYQHFNSKFLNILMAPEFGFLDDSKIVTQSLVGNGLIEGVAKHLSQNCKIAPQVILSMKFIRALAGKQPKLTKNIDQMCSQNIVKMLHLHKSDPDVLHEVFQTLYKLIECDPNIIMSFKEFGFEQVLAEILDQKDLNPQIFEETNTFLSTLISDDKIINALDLANSIAQKLCDSPNNVSLIEDLDRQLVFIGNVSGAENKFKTVIDNGGLILIPTCFQALSEAKDCFAREHAIKSAAFTAYKLGANGSPSDIIDDGCFEQMCDVYLENPNYEGLAENLAKLTQIALSDSSQKHNSYVVKMHDCQGIEANVAMISNFPLRDDLCALAAHNISLLAIDEQTCGNIIECKGFDAMISALSNMMVAQNTSECIKILESIAHVSSLAIRELISKHLASIDVKLFVDCCADKESPELIFAALKTLQTLCSITCDVSDSNFISSLVSNGGLTEIFKHLSSLDGIGIGIAMDIVSKCTMSATLDPQLLLDADIVKHITNTILNAPNANEIVLSSGVCAMAQLASDSNKKSMFSDELMSASTISAICSAVTARPRDAQLIISMTTFIANMVVTDGMVDPKILDVFKQSGLMDSLKSAAQVHCDNSDVIAHITSAFEAIEPKAENLLTQLLDGILNANNVIQTLKSILEIIIFERDGAPFSSKLLCDALMGVFNEYYKNNACNNIEIGQLMMDVVYELSESPEYCVPLMECGLVQLLMNATVSSDDAKLSDEEEALLSGLEGDMFNILNNLSMIDDGKAYLQEIGVQEVVVKSIMNQVGGHEKGHEKEQLLLRQLRTFDALQISDYSVLLSQGLLRGLQTIVCSTDNALLVKQAFTIINDITLSQANVTQIGDSGITDMIEFANDMKAKFGDKAHISLICDSILANLPNDNVQQVLVPPPAPMVMQQPPQMGGMIMSSGVGLPPPPPQLPQVVPVVMIDAEAAFQQALDRRLNEEQKEEAMLAFLDGDFLDADIEMLVENHGIDKLVSALSATKKVSQQRKLVNALDKVTGAGDATFSHFVSCGGVGAIMQTLNLAGASHDGPFMECTLDFIGSISVNSHLKSLLAMHNIIFIIFKCIRENPNNVDALDKCIYVLCNLAFDHQANVLQIIELGGLNDILGMCCSKESKGHLNNSHLMQSCMDLLANLMHNSDSNRSLICAKGGDLCILNVLNTHGVSFPKVAISCFRCLGNLAYVPLNISRLAKIGVISSIVSAMTSSLKNDVCLQMGAAVLSNIACDPRVSQKMIDSGVLNILLHISSAFPDLIELQKSCLGCMGNIANNVQNCQTMVDAGCGRVLFEIMGRLDFDLQVVELSLLLMKMLCISADVSTSFVAVPCLGAECIIKIIVDNVREHGLVRTACQALCKLIVNQECSRMVSTQGVVDGLCLVANDGNNFLNAPLMIDVLKVMQNCCSIEMNSASIARKASIPILRGLEALFENSIFVNVAATLLGNLAVYASASKHIVRRGGCAVLIQCIKHNVDSRGLLSKLVRCIANLVLTESKCEALFIDLQATDIVEQICKMYPSQQNLIKPGKAFLRAMRMRSHKLRQNDQQTQGLKDKIDIAFVKFLTSGVIVKKYCSSAKPRKRLIRCTDDLEYLLIIDPNGKKAPKQLHVRQITEIRTGASTFTLRRSGLGWKKADPLRSFAIFSTDSQGKEKTLDIQCKTEMDYKKWSNGLKQLITVALTKSIIKYT